MTDKIQEAIEIIDQEIKATQNLVTFEMLTPDAGKNYIRGMKRAVTILKAIPQEEEEH